MQDTSYEHNRGKTKTEEEPKNFHQESKQIIIFLKYETRLGSVVQTLHLTDKVTSSKLPGNIF